MEHLKEYKKLEEKELSKMDANELREASGKKVILRKSGLGKRVATYNYEPSKTDQQYKDDCDANSIIAKFHKTGSITHLAKVQGTYADVSEIPDLDVALQQVNEAKEMFMGLPSDLRAKFYNDPKIMLQYLQDPKNREEAVQLGLLPGSMKKEAKTPSKKVSSSEGAKSPSTGGRGESGSEEITGQGED